MAMGALVRGAVPFNMALEGTSVALVSLVVRTGLVFGIPNTGVFVVMWLLMGVIPIRDFCNSRGVGCEPGEGL